jgi:hypothetical protein
MLSSFASSRLQAQSPRAPKWPTIWCVSQPVVAQCALKGRTGQGASRLASPRPAPARQNHWLSGLDVRRDPRGLAHGKSRRLRPEGLRNRGAPTAGSGRRSPTEPHVRQCWSSERSRSSRRDSRTEAEAPVRGSRPRRSTGRSGRSGGGPRACRRSSGVPWHGLTTSSADEQGSGSSVRPPIHSV